MTRDELIELMQAWGWQPTDTVPGAWGLDVWTHPNGRDEALVPVDERAAGYARHLKRAEIAVAHAEGPRLLGVVREVAKAAVSVGVTPSDDPWWKGHEEAMRRVRVQLAPLTETTKETTVTSDCVFCQIIWGTAPGKIVDEWADAIALTPLTPVVDGHVLIIPKHHVAHAATDESITARTMGRAAEHATQYDSFNLITSAGRAATQSIDHLHVHVIPRVPDDQLMTPWGTIYGDDPTAPHWCRQAQELSDRLNGMT